MANWLASAGGYYGLPYNVEVELAGLRGDLHSMERAGWRISHMRDHSRLTEALQFRIGDVGFQQTFDDRLMYDMRGRNTLPIRLPADQFFGQVRRGPSDRKRIADLEAEVAAEKARADDAEARLKELTPDTVADHLARVIELQKAARPKSRRRAESVSEQEVRAGHLRVA